jgi:hypothetical protein
MRSGTLWAHSDPNSVMQPELGLWVTESVFYMTSRPLPDVDAQALERRYRSVDLPYDPKLLGCAIVGSTFQQTDEESQTPRVDVEQFCWGVRENTPTVPLMHGYCYNSALGARGYGYWMLHLLPPGPGEHLGGREYVVGGGILRRTEPGWAVTFGGRLNSLQDTRGYAPIPERKWGSDTGVIQLAARAQAWNPLLNGDADSMIYFVLGREDNLPSLRLEGFYTVIGAAQYPQEGRYTARGWGATAMGNASVIAEARTYAIEKEGSATMSFYENAKVVSRKWWKFEEVA